MGIILTGKTIFMLHDDVMKWKHFPRYWPFVRGIHRSPVNSTHKGQWRGALMFSLICVWINGWVNNREAGDLRRHGAHYDVIVMWNRTWHLDTWPPTGAHVVFTAYRVQLNQSSNTSKAQQIWLVMADDIFKRICLNKTSCIFMHIPLKCIPWDPIDNESTSVYIMGFCWTGDKALLKIMMTKSADILVHLKNQRVNSKYEHPIYSEISGVGFVSVTEHILERSTCYYTVNYIQQLYILIRPKSLLE